MRRISVGYVDGCMHPLWTWRLGFRMARWMGARSFWVPDHYVNFFPPHIWDQSITPAAEIVPHPDAIYDPITVLSYLATRYRGVDIGTSVTEAVRRHPMTLAQVFVSLDHLSKGHAILGIGAGERENTEPFGLDFSRPVSRLEEALIIIRMLWESDGKAINYDGHFWRLRDAVFGLPLYQGRAPRLFVGAHQPRMLRLTGKYGDGWLPSMKPASGEYRKRLEQIYEAAAKADRPLEIFTPCQLVPVAIGESREQMMEAILQSPLGAVLLMLLPDAAWQKHGLTHPLGEGHPGFDQIVPRRITPENIAYARSVMTPALVSSSVYVGGPRELVDQIAPVVDEGARHLIVSNIGFAFVKGGATDLLRLARFIRALRKL